MKFWIAAVLLVATVGALTSPVRAQGTRTSTSSVLVTLHWTSPGDDWDVGRATRYALRYSQTAVVEADTAGWWDRATEMAGLPTPSPAGTQEKWTGEVPFGPAYFMMRAADEIPNWSGWGNVLALVIVPPDMTPPSAVRDLDTTGVR